MLMFLWSQVCLVSLPWIAVDSDSAAIDQDQAEPFVTGSHPGHSLQPAQQWPASSGLLPLIFFSPPFHSQVQGVVHSPLILTRLLRDVFSLVSCPLPPGPGHSADWLWSTGSPFQPTYQVGTQETLGSPFSYKIQFYLPIIFGLKNSTMAALSLIMIHSFFLKN